MNDSETLQFGYRLLSAMVERRVSSYLDDGNLFSNVKNDILKEDPESSIRFLDLRTLTSLLHSAAAVRYDSSFNGWVLLKVGRWWIKRYPATANEVYILAKMIDHGMCEFKPKHTCPSCKFEFD